MTKPEHPLPLARKSHLITQEVADELIVYDRESDRAYCLNSTAAFVWKHCDGNTSVPRMASLLEEKTNAPVEHELVVYALEQLDKSKLLDAYAVSASKPGLSRRAIVRQGVAVAVAIPFISAITAPTAAQAATCLPAGAACSSDAACCSNNCADNGRGGFECT